MGKFQALLNLRLKQKDAQNPKMTALAEKTSTGNLSSFSGVFRVTALSEKEKDQITAILQDFKTDERYDVHNDLNALIAITSEVKAITNQAVILHGERIKKAQEILKGYRDGAFTSWLIATYGNRQTPYNFLQYYEFYIAMPQTLHPIIDEMPRQAVYTLASRSGEIDKKQEIISAYKGQPKKELLFTIRQLFPLSPTDKRLPNVASQVLHLLTKAKIIIQSAHCNPTREQKEKIIAVIQFLEKIITNSP